MTAGVCGRDSKSDTCIVTNNLMTIHVEKEGLWLSIVKFLCLALTLVAQLSSAVGAVLGVTGYFGASLGLPPGGN